MRAPSFWDRPRASAAATLLSPFGAIVGAVAARRMARPSQRVERPVVCVGNFVVGGAGKTPTAIAIARLLQARGLRVSFLSRGYGGAARAAPLQVDPNVHTARQVGDEPLLLARVAKCFVGPNRLEAAREAIAAGADALIMDDGLQSPSLHKDAALAVVDGEVGFGNGLCIPAGPLRAPIEAQAPFVSALVVVGEGAAGERVAAGPLRHVPVFRARLEADAVVAASLVGRSVLAFAGIARPEKFFSTLERLGALVVKRRAFADHHPFQAHTVEKLLAEAASRMLIPVTTEKDLVRIAPAYRKDVVALPASLRFEDPPSVAGFLAARLGRPQAAS